jgi:CHAT domain-containing protein
MENAVLTAREIALMDLRGLELVVLSACQTGRGLLRDDGVFGLQRGFKKAGAHTLLMSLWSVDDQATMMMMTAFYKELANGASRHEAFRAAQHTLREDPRFSRPVYWASFIMLDD